MGFLLVFCNLILWEITASEGFQPRKSEDLQQLVSGKLWNPKAQEIISVLRQETGLNLTLGDSVIQDRPIQGHTVFAKVPAWMVMENLANNKYILGKWQKIGNEYRLEATYSGPPPPIPPIPPPPVAARIKTSTGLDPTKVNNTEPKDQSFFRLLVIGISLATLFFVIIVILRKRYNLPRPS